MFERREILGIRMDEMSVASRVVTIFFVIQMSHAFSTNGADALFFTKFGVENLPLMIAGSGVLTMVVLIGHSVGMGQVPPTRWISFVTAGSALSAVALWRLSLGGWRWVYPVVWMATQAIVWLTFTVMWNVAGATADTRQAKRLFPVYASAGVAGAIVGNLLTGTVAGSVGTEALLALQALLLVGGTYLVASTARYFDRTDDVGSGSAWRALLSAARTVTATPLIRLVALASFTLWALFYMVVFPFNEVVAASFATDTAIAGFLGLFASVATAATFLLSLLGTKRLFARLGVVNSLLLVPAVYALGFGVWLVSFDLTSATAIRGLQWVAVNAIGGTALISLFNVLPGRLRGRVSAFVTAVPAQLGIVVAGLIVLIGPSLGNRTLFIIGMSTAVLTALLVTRMRSAYVEALIAAVRGGLVGVFRAPHEHVAGHLGRESIELLEQHLVGESPDERMMAIAALGATHVDGATDMIEPLIDDPDPQVRAAAFASLSENEDFVLRHYDRLLDDDWAPLRRRVLDASAVLGPEVQAEVAGRLIGDPDPSVRAAAAWLLGGSQGQAVLDRLVASSDAEVLVAALSATRGGSEISIDHNAFVEHADPDVRAVALAHLRGQGPELQTLRRALDDPAIKVRRTAAQRLAAMPSGQSILQEVLDSGSVIATDIALRTLDPGDLIEESLLAWAQREVDRASMLAGSRVGLLSGHNTPAIAYLADVLLRRSQRISDWVVLALRTPTTSRELDLIDRGIWSEDQAIRAQAYEALDALADHSVTAPLLTLLEATSRHETLSQGEALRLLSVDFDPWLSDLARRAIHELDGTPMNPSGESQASLSDSNAMTAHSAELLDKMIALHRVEMFSGLDPEDLGVISDAVQEVTFGSRELIYAEGDQAHEMLIVVDGQAVVSTSRDGIRRRLTEYGKGQHVGELALLQKSTRSADVYAGDRGMTGLAIREADLRSILEERPAVAMAMLRTLAKRLAEQA